MVKVCFHCRKAEQISLQFDEFFDQKNQMFIWRRFEIFTKNSHLKLVGTHFTYGKSKVSNVHLVWEKLLCNQAVKLSFKNQRFRELRK